jgi:acetyl-CoA C-acetyltransferase
MRNVSIIGAGMLPVGEHWTTSLRELAATAGVKALEDASIQTVDAIYVGNAYGSTFNQQTQLGALIADFMNLTGIEAYTCEAGDASGGVALRNGYLAIASGAVESVLVIGVEKATDIVASARTLARSISLDADFETPNGATLTTMAGLLMRRYMYEYDVELSKFEGFSVNAHRNGKRSTYAMYRNTLREGAFAKAPMVSDPVSLFDSAPDGDGAAAVVLVASDLAKDMVPQPVTISGSSVKTDRLMLQERDDILALNAVAQSSQQALKQANRNMSDIDLMELHDAYTILTTLAFESLGLAEKGQGWKWADNNGEQIDLAGKIPISTFGGLKSRGNPCGATGIYQAVEAVLQLRGQAADNQVADAQHAIIQNLGGLASTVATHILSIDNN